MTCTGYENECFCAKCCDKANEDDAVKVMSPSNESAPFYDVSYITEYGLTQKLSRPIRVF